LCSGTKIINMQSQSMDMETSQPHSAKSNGLLFLVCQPPARHSLPTQMPNLDFRGLRWWMRLLAHGSITNYSPRRVLTVANGATQDDPAIAFVPFTHLRPFAHP
jgi:hypothetical protein